MKTCGDIEKELEEKSQWYQEMVHERGGFEPFMEGWVEALRWVLDLDEEEEIIEKTPFDWNSVPVRSWEEIHKDLEDFLTGPSPFLRYFKEKSNEDQS